MSRRREVGHGLLGFLVGVLVVFGVLAVVFWASVFAGLW